MKCYIRDENKEKNFKEYYKDIRFYFKKCLKHLKITKDYEVTLIINNDEAIKKINRDYRGIDKATDVLSFASLEGEAPLDENYLGDIFISKDKIISQAKKYHHSI